MLLIGVSIIYWRHFSPEVMFFYSGRGDFLKLERDRRYVSYYFKPPSVRVAFGFT